MQATSVLLFAFFAGMFDVSNVLILTGSHFTSVAVCFPEDALIGIRFAPLQRQERETEQLIGVRHWDEDDSSEFVAISPKLQRKAVSPTQEDLPIGSTHRLRTGGFCGDNMAYYESHCLGMFTDRDEQVRQALYKFCPWFENKCLH
ncbi:hypothetical protein Y032_0027g1582 [Ancylostoma ceylanicum]|uniref:Uncharacterized protein n=1 Tax=Ancylostoma ceylanicum TaxID=53326 RepID=A0A016UUV6_9BILA|nr:hypothetical protein Y032_0027g1582 [Ancylostoma ceylanicum]